MEKNISLTKDFIGDPVASHHELLEDQGRPQHRVHEDGANSRMTKTERRLLMKQDMVIVPLLAFIFFTEYLVVHTADMSRMFLADRSV